MILVVDRDGEIHGLSTDVAQRFDAPDDLVASSWLGMLEPDARSCAAEFLREASSGTDHITLHTVLSRTPRCPATAVSVTAVPADGRTVLRVSPLSRPFGAEGLLWFSVAHRVVADPTEHVLLAMLVGAVRTTVPTLQMTRHAGLAVATCPPEVSLSDFGVMFERLVSAGSAHVQLGRLIRPVAGRIVGVHFHGERVTLRAATARLR